MSRSDKERSQRARLVQKVLVLISFVDEVKERSWYDESEFSTRYMLLRQQLLAEIAGTSGD